MNSKGFRALELLSAETEVKEFLLSSNMMFECVNSISNHLHAVEVLLPVFNVISILEVYAVESSQEDTLRNMNVCKSVVEAISENGFDVVLLRSGLLSLEHFIPFDLRVLSSTTTML